MKNDGPEVGATWQGEYLLQASLGDPSNGVFRAQRRRDSQPVAVRIWRAPNEPLAHEFLEHANAACAVRHVAIAQVEAAGRQDQFCFVVSEYIVGQKLDTWADQVGIPPLGEVIELMRRLCEGLALAARGGVTHSALHPRNVVMVQGDPASSRRALPKLLDLGVPQVARPRLPHSLAAQFMAPEQLAIVLDQGQPPPTVSHATSVMNVYSCGALLYYLCTGGPPHRQTEPSLLREAQLQGKLVIPSRINPQITPSLNAVMMQALAIDPTVRYSTVSDLADALTHVSLTPSVAGVRPVLSMAQRERVATAPPGTPAPRAVAMGRDRVLSPPPAISIPPGISRRPPPMAATSFEEEHETARTGAVRVPSKRPIGAWIAPPEAAGSTAPPPPPLRDSVPAGSFSSAPPPRIEESRAPVAPVLAAPLALFSGAPSHKPDIAPAMQLELESNARLVASDTETTRPPGERQRNPMMWFGVLAAVACALLVGLVRLLGNPSSAPGEQTPTVTIDRPLIEGPPRAAAPVPGAVPASPQPAAPAAEPEPPPAFPSPTPPSILEHEREREAQQAAAARSAANSSQRSSSRSTSRSSTGAVAAKSEPHGPSGPAQPSAPAREVVNEPEIPLQHIPEPAASPNPPSLEPIAPSVEPAQQASKAAPRGPDASVASAPSAVPREDLKPTPVETPNLPLEAKATIGEVTSRGSMPTSLVRRAVERINPQLSGCYARAAQSAGKNAFGAVTVEVDLDERGRARSPSARGGKLSGLNDCVAEAASKVISDRAPDTGTIHASFKVIFSP